MTTTPIEVETAAAPARPTARERLLETANRLFYAEGIQSVGIDRIIDEAGVAKASLYKSFGSKEALIGAYLDTRHDSILTRLRAAADGVDDPREKIMAVFEVQAGVYARPTYHGCAFASASAEATAGGEVDRATAAYRSDLRALLRELAVGLGVADPDTTAMQLHLIYDGGSQSARLDHDPSVGPHMLALVVILLDAVTP